MIGALLVFSSLAFGATLQEGLACLARNDVPCAQQVVEDLGAESSRRPEELSFAAETAFFAGDFPRALEILERAVAAGYVDRYDRVGLYTRTRDITASYQVAKRGRFEVHYAPGVDLILVEDALDTLELAERHLAPLLGGPPPGVTRLEIYPDGRSFKGVVALPPDAVERTGVVAISKWSRLLVISPRALGRGYGWQDTIAHEYVHLVLSHHTQERAPLWMQEGVAKFLDENWQDGKDHFRLTVEQQGLMAKGLATNTMVTRAEMGNSFATMDSAERSSLAYAIVSSQMQFAFKKGGDELLRKVIPVVRAGGDPSEALARAAGYPSFATFEADWVTWLRGQGFVSRKLASMPTVLDGGNDFDLDPVLSRRDDLARWVRLGDLLGERGHHAAALVEYTKAIPTDEPSSPLLDNRMAQSYQALGSPEKAREILEQSLAYYPDFTLTHKTLGDLHRAAGRKPEAIVAYTRAASYNPFDRDVQLALAELCEETGNTAEAKRRREFVRVLSRAGTDTQETR